MWKVFAVKTLYRTSVTGKAFATDDSFSNKYDQIEERVVTIKARSFDEAIKRAEVEAEEYAEGSHINPYGQDVTQKYTGIVNAYEPFDTVPANLEVYSNTFIVLKTITDDNLADNFQGDGDCNNGEWRKNFLNSEFSGFVS
jgi:hypothetical protein